MRCICRACHILPLSSGFYDNLLAFLKLLGFFYGSHVICFVFLKTLSKVSCLCLLGNRNKSYCVSTQKLTLWSQKCFATHFKLPVFHHKFPLRTTCVYGSLSERLSDLKQFILTFTLERMAGCFLCLSYCQQIPNQQ